MSDLTNTLRAVAEGDDYTTNVNHLCDEAAAEVERLTAEKKYLVEWVIEEMSVSRNYVERALRTNLREK